MIKDDERREIARRLRESVPEGDVFPSGDTSWSRLYRTLFGEYMPIQSAATTYRQVAERLADLMEPAASEEGCSA